MPWSDSESGIQIDIDRKAAKKSKNKAITESGKKLSSESVHGGIVFTQHR
jgi:hypothetical protein